MNKEWLPHLKDCVPATVSGDRLSIYAIALEGWRRGLTLKFYTSKLRNKIIVRYTLSNNEKEIYFSYTAGEGVTPEAMRISGSKILTKKQLLQANVPTPPGKEFTNSTTNKEIISYAQSIGFPVVVKPTNGKMGKGVISNITTENELRTALNQLRENVDYQNVIVEKFIAGKEYRVYVVGGEVVGAINRVPAHVIGDGTNTIRDLIRNKNKERKQIPSLRGRPIKIDVEVKRNITKEGYTLKSILKENEHLFLRRNSNVSSGGEPVDVTDYLPEKIRQIAIDATKAVPNLCQCGVDIIVDESSNSGAVIEINTKPGIASHLYPVKGKARDIPKAIIDYYFPESRSENKLTNQIFFDYKKISSLLLSGMLSEVQLPNISLDTFKVKAFKVYGNVQNVGYRNWIRKNALFFDLNGFVENKTDGSVFIVVAGDINNFYKFKKHIELNGPRDADVRDIIETDWDKPIEVGFEITQQNDVLANQETSLKRDELVKLEKEIASLAKEKEDIQEKLIEMSKQKDKIQKMNQDILNSSSWKYTKPVRKMSSLLKKKTKGKL